MDQLKIKTYTPTAPSYAPRIRNEQWEQHKSLLKHLHDEGCRRADMLSILRKQGFTPSVGQLNAKMTAWGFKVYGTQSETPEPKADVTPRAPYLTTVDTLMADLPNSEPALSPVSRKSISSVTLSEPPDRPLSAPIGDTKLTPDTKLTLNETIIRQSLALAGSYWPVTKPSDFGFKQPSSTTSGANEVYYESVVLVADFLYAVHCFEQAFDLYYHVFEHLLAKDLTDGSLVRGLVQCAISATTDSQCSYVLSMIHRTYAYCVEHGLLELTSCFRYLLQDLYVKEMTEMNVEANLDTDRASDIPLLIATDSKAKSLVYRREWLEEQLTECDGTCATLSHLSTWCQDTLNFYRLSNTAITLRNLAVVIDDMTSLENGFQKVVEALIIDYLNSPGPSMKRAVVECKEHDCLFRSALSPSTSLIVMAHLLYEPLRLQSQPHLATNRYLQTRANHFAMSQGTTALQELKSFASMNTNIRCGAFVDTYMKHFNTTLAFRRFISTIDSTWDKINAAKRLAQVLQSNQTGFLPHAGLPSARRSVLKTMVAPFPHDPSFTESRPSVISENGSLGEFERYANQIGLSNAVVGTATPSDAMSIDTRSSWSFTKVTGLGPVPLSARNSLSSRHSGIAEEMEEYRYFIKENNYSQQDIPADPGTPVPRYATPTIRDYRN